MSRAFFLSSLRQGLKGLSAGEIDDILADYEAHFNDAMAAGRTEADIASSLGNPLQLGAEIGAETKLRRWETKRNPRTFVGAGFALIGLQAFNVFILLPIIVALTFCAMITAYVLYVVGRTGFVLMAGLLSGDGDVLIPALVGAALVCGVVGIGALIALILDSGLRLLGRYVRLNYRLLKPADADGE